MMMMMMIADSQLLLLNPERKAQILIAQEFDSPFAVHLLLTAKIQRTDQKEFQRE